MQVSSERLELLRARFQAAYWDRGVLYHGEGKVNLILVGEVEARARVEGSKGAAYDVRLGETGRANGVEGFCSCPIGYGCKHIVATLHALAQQHSLEAKAPGAVRVQRWLDNVEDPKEEEEEHDDKDELVFVLNQGSGRSNALVVGTYRRIVEKGVPRLGQRLDLSRRGTSWLDKIPSHEDRRVWWELQEAATDAGAAGSLRHETPLLGPRGREMLKTLVDTGRCVFLDADQPLAWGRKRKGELSWRFDGAGTQTLGVQLLGRKQKGVEQGGHLLSTTPATYRAESREGGFMVGALELQGLGDSPLAAGFSGTPIPSVSPQDSRALKPDSLARMAALGIPEPQVVGQRPAKERTPVLRVCAEPDRRGIGDRLELAFAYDNVTVDDKSGDTILRFDEDEAPYVIVRDDLFEQGARDRIEALGFDDYGAEFLARDYATWSAFVLKGRRELEAQGWRVEIEHDADLARPVIDEEELRLSVYDASAKPAKGRAKGDVAFEQWAELSLDVCIDGQFVSLVPALETAIWAGDLQGDSLQVTEAIPLVVVLEDQSTRVVVMPRERIQASVDVLVELFDLRDRSGSTERLRVRHGALARLGLGLSWLDFHAPKHLAKLAKSLRGFESLKAVPVPGSLNADLRAYQVHGLSWLQFLRKRELGGVLADDMGLGKTVQALAHILIEFEAGRLDRPVLVVAPRSVLVNWQREAGRFAPQLSVAVWHGQRRAGLGDPDAYHVVVTSYATLRRDAALQAQPWHLVILDEAQAIKNPASKTRQSVRELKTRHRLAMTGTPVENNLLELWSLFDVLMPGYLGSRREFQEHFRTPIEKRAEAPRMRALQRRVAPFLLRRTKQEVLPELPPKTEVIEWVQLEGDQSELYESVRAGLEKSVRSALKQRGLVRSQIVVLDALLKLRQVCCDPRLVKLERARKVQQSAKLERLLERLETLVAAGRRALVFSQFATMLGLIEEALAERGLASQKLTGRTRHRQPLIDRFQAGEVPIFLISLKAGGTGLNLTAADVVIHYDPWWNPAAEDQATDRAHRIGQDKPVTVYKLVAAGSVEAAILDLQARKAELAAQVQEGARALGGAIKSEDLAVLFAPLEGEQKAVAAKGSETEPEPEAEAEAASG